MARAFVLWSLILAAPLQARRVQMKEQMLAAEGKKEKRAAVAPAPVQVTAAPSQEADKFVCGALESTYSACYPKARDWGLGSFFKAEACTTQCQRSMGMCYCPNSGQSCTSAGSRDPGFHFFNVEGSHVEREQDEDGHDFPNQPLLSRAIKVNPKTREWQYLAAKQSGNATTWVWEAPAKAGKSFLAANAFAKFELLLNKKSKQTITEEDRELTEEGHDFPNGRAQKIEVISAPQIPADTCDPVQMGKYIQSLGM
mmetsp:Transcript_151407/g.275507  ORF Transcript_151407/g.275507 Transcript_151407/m.275507 type:complete len:255 (-) Transcript_151407:110-874(-)